MRKHIWILNTFPLYRCLMIRISVDWCVQELIKNQMSESTLNLKHNNQKRRALINLGILILTTFPSFQLARSLSVPFHIIKKGGNGRCCSLLFQNKDRDDSGSDAGKMLESASRLRREALELEAEMSKTRLSSVPSSTFNKIMTQEKKYETLSDSKWLLTYRFSSEPYSKDSDEGSNLQFYAGTIPINLRSDGYTDILKEEKNEKKTSGKKIEFTKFWGWDEEIENEDDQNYLSFSADILFPLSDANYSDDASRRVYFTARVDKDEKSGEITLSDGTVTLKSSYEPLGGGWGLFNAGGILAQFQYCGEFLCKAK